MDLIESLQTFKLLFKEQKYAAVAKKLQTNSSTISKRIAFLEQFFHAQLFHRTTRKMRPTTMGKRLYENIDNWLIHWEKILDTMTEDKQTLRGQIAIASTPWLGSYFVKETVLKYLNQHRDVEVTQIMTSNAINLIHDNVDVALVTAIDQKLDETVESIEIATLNNKLYCSKDYLKKNGKIISIADLKNHRLISICRSDQAAEIWDLGTESITVKGAYHVQDIACAIDAIFANIGIAYLPNNGFINKDKQIINVLPKCCSKDYHVYLQYSLNRYITYLLEDFIDFAILELKSIFSNYYNFRDVEWYQRD